MLPRRCQSVLVEFMSFRDGRAYDLDTTFTTQELSQITPKDICRWMNMRAYGTDEPTENMKPTHARSSTLLNAKKSLSAFMPRKSAPWDPIRNEGNPTRSDCVNKRIKRAEALKERDEPPSQRTLELFEQDVIPGLSDARVLLAHRSGGGDAALNPVDRPRLHSSGDGAPPQSIEMRVADEDTSNSVGCEQGRLRADGQRNEFAVLHSHLFGLYRKLDEMTDEIRSLRRDLESMDQRNHVNFGHNVPQPEVQAAISTPSTSSAPESHLPASLSRRPKDLFQLWHEYVIGCDGSKPAKAFTASERGAEKSKYCRRKAFWDVVRIWFVRASPATWQLTKCMPHTVATPLSRRSSQL